MCVCARAGLASISQVADVVSGKWSSQGPRVEPERVVLTLAWSSLEGKVGAGEGPFRMDHQAGLEGVLNPLGPASGVLTQHQWEGCDISVLQETFPA